LNKIPSLNMDQEAIRWKQRFQNFCKALVLLEEAVERHHKQGLSDLEEQGLIQRFEFTHELAWNVLKDYFVYQGIAQITGSRDATREAYNIGLIEDGDSWMLMIKSRNLSTHTYNEETAKELVKNITQTYTKLFLLFKNKMESLPHN
jgi:nucleotidyltransferase substrate binding protein (TIGR01987 family)